MRQPRPFTDASSAIGCECLSTNLSLLLPQSLAKANVQSKVTRKDSLGEAFVGYSYPWMIDGSLNTVITIANPSQTEEIMYCLFISYEGKSYTYEGKWLKPGEVKQTDKGFRSIMFAR